MFGINLVTIAEKRKQFSDLNGASGLNDLTSPNSPPKTEAENATKMRLEPGFNGSNSMT